MFFKKGVLKNLAIFKGILTCVGVSFLLTCSSEDLIKKRLHYEKFSKNTAKIFRSSFFKNRWL